jgi:hydroxymethylpyrimidine pyrophosphatase-like HAD family hydrolase
MSWPSTHAPRLLATDLDGTLLHSDGTVSSRTRAALAALEDAGVPVVFVTARPPRWMDDLTDLVGPHGTALCANGAFTYDVRTRVVSDVHALSFAVVAEVVTDLRGVLPGTVFAAERPTGFAHEELFESRHPVPSGTPVGPIEGHRDAPIGKLLARHPTMSDSAFLAAVEEVVGDRGIIAYSGAGGLAEITAPGVTKAVVLERWCAEHGIPRGRVWSFGDMPNDLPMLRWAGESFAVANAHPEVRAAARHTCPANDDDGVAQVIEHVLANGLWADH